MTLRLSAADLARVARAQHTLLTPLDFPSIDAWRHAVNAAVAEVVGADSAGFLLPLPTGPHIYSAEHGDVLNAFPELAPPDLSDGTPIWQQSIRLGASTIRSAYGPDTPVYHRSAYFNEYAGPNGARDSAALWVGITSEDTYGAATVQLWRDRFERPFRAREIALLRLLFPAFTSGVQLLVRAGADRGRFLDLLDRLPAGVLVMDTAGIIVAESAALRRLLEHDPDADTLRTNLYRAANAGPASCHGVVRTAAGDYRIDVALHEATGQRLTLAILERTSRRIPGPLELQRRFGLTPAEGRVALLIAEGRSTAGIAAELGITASTARRHTERVYAKLGVNARAQVRPRIDSSDPGF